MRTDYASVQQHFDAQELFRQAAFLRHSDFEPYFHRILLTRHRPLGHPQQLIVKGVCAEAPASRTPLPDDIGSLDELETVIAEIASQEDERAKATVRELLDEQLALTRDETTAGLSIETLQPGRFTGQVIRDGERIVYASLPATQKWLADNKWRTAKPFAI